MDRITEMRLLSHLGHGILELANNLHFVNCDVTIRYGDLAQITFEDPQIGLSKSNVQLFLDDNGRALFNVNVNYFAYKALHQNIRTYMDREYDLSIPNFPNNLYNDVNSVFLEIRKCKNT